MSNTATKADDLITESTSTHSTVYAHFNDDLHEDLLVLCEDWLSYNENGDEVYEYWGATDDGDWRIILRLPISVYEQKNIQMIDCKVLCDLLSAAAYTPFSYSGRGMYGKRCVAVEAKNEWRLCADLCMEALSTRSLVDEVSNLNVKQDNMGKDGIVIYFPDVAWEETEEE